MEKKDRKWQEVHKKEIEIRMEGEKMREVGKVERRKIRKTNTNI